MDNMELTERKKSVLSYRHLTEDSFSHSFRAQLCLVSQIRNNMVTMSGAPMVHAGSLLASLIILPLE